MVYQVLMDKATNKARGVSYVDRITRETREVRARTVVLRAGARVDAHPVQLGA